MMRVGNYAAGLLVAVVSAPGFAAEPDGPATIIARTELVRITVEDRLSAKFSATSARKVEQDALVQYYAVPDHGLLWIDETGLNERARPPSPKSGKPTIMAFAAQIMPYPILTALTPPMQRPPNGSPTLRSQSATPCSIMRVMLAAGGLIRSA